MMSKDSKGLFSAAKEEAHRSTMAKKQLSSFPFVSIHHPLFHFLVIAGSSMLLASRTVSAFLRPSTTTALRLRGLPWLLVSHSSFGCIPSNSTRTMTSSSSFQAWRVEQQSDGSFQGSEQTLSTDALPHADTTEEDDSVLIRVSHSSLNYKDALSAAGNPGVTRKFPHTPGIDAVGTLVSDPSQTVLVTGYDLGMNTDGGFGEIIRVPSHWVVAPLPFASGGGEDGPADCSVAGAAAQWHRAGGALAERPPLPARG